MKTFVFIFLIVALFLTGCSSEVICSSPFVLIDRACCLDANGDGSCDESSSTPSSSSQEPPESLTSPEPRSREVISYRGLLDDDPSIGSLDAPLTLVAFGDYQDKFSQRFHRETLPLLLEGYGPSLLYVYRDYRASPDYQHSGPAALAANCADEQGAFLEYHTLLYEHSPDLFDSSLLAYAEDLDLDIDRFRSCMDTRRYQEEVIGDFDDGASAGVTVTPTFFLNGEKIVGFRTFDFFDALIRERYAHLLLPSVAWSKGKEFFIDYSHDAKANLILPGNAVLDTRISSSPYSNTIDLVDATFTAHLVDKTDPNGTSLDYGTFSSEFSFVYPDQHTAPAYRLVLTEFLPLPSPLSSEGTIATSVPIYGHTDIGTSLLPRVTAVILFWGKADLYDGTQQIASDIPLSFAVTHGIRSDGLLQPTADTSDVEASLFFPTDYETRDYGLPFNYPFVSLFWENLTLKTL